MDGRLPFLIGYTPRSLKKEIVLPLSDKKHFYYDLVSNEKIIIDEQVSKGFYYFGSGVILLSVISFLITKGQLILGSLILFGIGLVLLLYAFTVSHKEVIL